MSKAMVYLIPSQLDETGFVAIPAYVTDAVKDCQVFFVENERSARRFLKQLWKVFLPGQEIVIDDYEWYSVPGPLTGPDTSDAEKIFKQKIKEGKTIGIISEAGCPGIADPGQQLVSIAHEMNAAVKPLAGPSSILLALMASGMNGQQFRFAGYLPIKQPDRNKAIKELENESAKRNCTQIFIETPYRNNQLLETLLAVCSADTKLCIATNITGEQEYIKTMRIADWKKNKKDLHKQPAIFLLLATS
jgi:16S rRNA (cytidine1402-2'-O)-methyltransferase